MVNGERGLLKSGHPGQIIVELGSYAVPDKEQYVAPFAQKGAAFLDGEVSGTPGMVAARKAVIYLAGDKEACSMAQRVIAGFSDECLYFGPFGAASRVKLVNTCWSQSTSRRLRKRWRSLRAGGAADLMIKAIADGSGGSTQFRIRAPWMAARRFVPAQGTAAALQHYFDLIGGFADSVGVATPMLDRTAELYDKFMDVALAELDVAAMVDTVAALPRSKS